MCIEVRLLYSTEYTLYVYEAVKSYASVKLTHMVSCHLLILARIMSLTRQDKINSLYLLNGFVIRNACPVVCCRSTLQTMGCPTGTVLMESTKNTRKTPRRAIMEPSSTPALMPTKDLVSFQIHQQINTSVLWVRGWSVDLHIMCGNLVDQQRLCVAAITMCRKLHEQFSLAIKLQNLHEIVNKVTIAFA